MAHEKIEDIENIKTQTWALFNEWFDYQTTWLKSKGLSSRLLDERAWEKDTFHAHGGRLALRKMSEDSAFIGQLNRMLPKSHGDHAFCTHLKMLKHFHENPDDISCTPEKMRLLYQQKSADAKMSSYFRYTPHAKSWDNAKKESLRHIIQSWAKIEAQHGNVSVELIPALRTHAPLPPSAPIQGCMTLQETLGKLPPKALAFGSLLNATPVEIVSILSRNIEASLTRLEEDSPSPMLSSHAAIAETSLSLNTTQVSM